MRGMIIHILCLILTFRVGFSSPVDILGSILELIDFGDVGNGTIDGKYLDDTIDGPLGQDRSFTDDTVVFLGDVYDVADTGSCCQECQKKFFDTTLFGVSKKSFNHNDCACLKPVHGRRPATRAAGEVSDQCGVWNFLGDGALGDGRYFQSGVAGLGLVTGVEDAWDCCDECQRMNPDTQLYTFYKGKDYCSCHKTVKGLITVTSGSTYAAGTCAAIPLEDMMMGDAPAAPANQVLVDHDETGVVGAVGESRSLKLDTVEYQGDVNNVMSEVESARCCQDCQKEWPQSHLYIFSKKKNKCYCYKEISGKKPETVASSKFFSSVCHNKNNEKKA